MSTPTPAPLKDRICAYYLETTEAGYLSRWAGETLAFHIGLGDEGTPHAECLLETNRYLAERAAITAGTRVLDAGCGVGGSAIWLAAERKARVVGVTLAQNQVEIGRRLATDRGVSDLVTLLQGDFMALQEPEATFDVVWNIESLCHAHDPSAYLEQVFALLRDGGRFACIDMFDGGTNPDAIRTICDGWVLPGLERMEALLQMMKNVGFVEVESENLTARTRHSARVMHSLAQDGLLRLEAERLLFGSASEISEKHSLAALAASESLGSGALVYGYLGGVRPARR
jgi:SAM-dependent methyltransferase